MCACAGSTFKGVDAMGRGRQKAKQTKVARELKYYSPSTDYDALQKELGHDDPLRPSPPVDDTDAGSDDGEYDEYADWASNGRH
jgi:hypothetical protein